MVKRNHIMLLMLALLLTIGAGQAVQAADSDEVLVTALFFDTDIREALSEISLLTGINIIPDNTVRGAVTADLIDVPLERALRMLLIGGGFSYRKIDGFYFVGLPDPRSTTFGELVDAELVPLSHVSVARVMASLPNFLASYVKGDPEGNVMIITAPPAELQRIRTLIRGIDQPQQQIEVSVLVTEVSSEGLHELGNTLLEFDGAHGQSLNDNWEAAFKFNEGSFTLNTNVYGKLLTTLRLLQEDQEATIHADPRVVVSNGKPASVFMGDHLILQVPGTNDTTRVERVEVGMNLKVTANVMNGDEIVLQLEPEFSYFRKDIRTDMLVRQNSVSTTVRVKDGQTILLAGMTVQDEADYTKKVPLLGDIPFLGWLFKREVQQQSERGLLVFVTPVIQ